MIRNFQFIYSLFCISISGFAVEPTAIEAGRQEIWHAYRNARPQWSYSAFFELQSLWAQQAEDAIEKERLGKLEPGSNAFWTEVKKRYGLHQAPYENDNLPLGLTKTVRHFENRDPGISVNCQFCHSTYLPQRSSDGKIEPKFAQGIPNVFADMERLHRDLSSITQTSPGSVMVRNHERNSFNNHADFFGELVRFLRPGFGKPSLLRYNLIFRHMKGRTFPPWLARQKEHMKGEFLKAPPTKTQPWINYRYKTQGGKRMLYVDGGFDGESTDVTYAMAFSSEPSGEDYLKAKEDFKRGGQEFLRAQEPLPYPFEIRAELANRGAGIFHGIGNCVECHGKYEMVSGRWTLTHYPQKIVPIEEIATDPVRALWMPVLPTEQEGQKGIDGKIVKTGGYIAPPLVGIWSRAPYLHNGSVPNLAQVLNSRTRSKVWFALPASDDGANFDEISVGWKLVEREALTPADSPYYRQFDPKVHIGMGNGGHLFGDHLNESERLELIEFLKQL